MKNIAHILLWGFLSSQVHAASSEEFFLPWTETKISKELMSSLGELSFEDFTKEIFERFGIRVFVCEPGESGFWQQEETSIDFQKLRDLIGDEETRELYCESFRSPEAVTINGLFLDAEVIFQPSEDLPKLARPYPIILMWPVAVRENLVHEFLHYLIARNKNRPALYQRNNQEVDKAWKRYDELLERFGELEAEQKDSAPIEAEMAAIYFEELIRTYTEEMDVYRFLIENSDLLGLDDKDKRASEIGYYSRLQHLLSETTQYYVPLAEKSGNTELLQQLNQYLPRIQRSLEWTADQNREIFSMLDAYRRQ